MGPGPIIRAIRYGRAAPHLLPPPARRRRRDDPARRRRAGRGQGVLQPRRPRPIRPITPSSPGRRRPRIGADDDPRARPRLGRGSRRPRRHTPATISSGRANSAGFLYIEQDDNHRPCRVMLHRLGTPARATTSRCSPSRIRPGSSASPGRSIGRTAMIDVHGHDASETRVVDLDHPAASAAPRRAAPVGPFLRRARRTAIAFFIRTNNDGARLQDRLARRATAPGRSELARRRARIATARLIDAAALFQDYLVLLAREDSRPRLDRPRPRERRAPRRRLRRGDLLRSTSRRSTNSTARHSVSPTRRWRARQEIYDYDMRHARADAASSARRSRRATTPRTMSTRLVFAPAPDGETRAGVAAYAAGPDDSTVRRRCCSTATAPMAMRSTRASRPTGCRWSIAASSSPSRMCAAAPTRAGAGTRTASSPTSPTRSPTSSPRPAI